MTLVTDNRHILTVEFYEKVPDWDIEHPPECKIETIKDGIGEYQIYTCLTDSIIQNYGIDGFANFPLKSGRYIIEAYCEVPSRFGYWPSDAEAAIVVIETMREGD